MTTIKDQKINLTEEEKKLFKFLLSVVDANDSKTVLRVAGGWVRDKLMGHGSDDIDIALDNMTGSAFATLINDYETSHGHVKHPVGIIKANPEQSKHLETATIQFGNNWVDLVNLRAETYADHSRIPQMTFGTPLEDATRRDFTINSLFYNIRDQTVEDWTGMGLTDLTAGLIRTPLNADETFLDDPIRALRAIRFASRFAFDLEPTLTRSITRASLQEALKTKISRERVGKELVGMLTGSRADPSTALELLHRHHLNPSVFTLPTVSSFVNAQGSPLVPQPFDSSTSTTMEHEHTTWQSSVHYATHMHRLLKSQDVMADKNRVRLAMLSAVLLPLASVYAKGFKGGKLQHVPYHIVSESLKLPKRDATQISTVILSHLDAFRSLAIEESSTRDRSTAGLLLKTVGPLWEICRDVSCLRDVKADPNPTSGVTARYTALTSWIHSVGLMDVWNTKCLMNGKELMSSLGVKPGPGMKSYVDATWQWQLKHPTGTKAECLAHLKTIMGNESSSS